MAEKVKAEGKKRFLSYSFFSRSLLFYRGSGPPGQAVGFYCIKMTQKHFLQIRTVGSCANNVKRQFAFEMTAHANWVSELMN